MKMERSIARGGIQFQRLSRRFSFHLLPSAFLFEPIYDHGSPLFHLLFVVALQQERNQSICTGLSCKELISTLCKLLIFQHKIEVTLFRQFYQNAVRLWIDEY